MTQETHTFQAEVRQLLDIVIHSLYTDREIFIRELVSNASDALEKLRHLQLTGQPEIFDAELPLEINITTDDGAGTISIADYGVGMTRQELVENLGTIAHSGTRAFLQALKESGGASPASLIGKFGVGFYSVFMVAQRVRVYTHSHRPEGEHLLWTSEGDSGYEIEESPGQRRGTRIVIELKEEAKEFARKEVVRRILRTYSNFVPFPIFLNGERVNTVEALWLKNKGEVSEEQYAEFYKFAFHAGEEPRYRLHFSADAPLQIHALLFVPRDNPEKMGLGQTEPGVALYCRRVLIDAHPPEFLPEWLRFVRGIVDSEDLPLNISRESMQDSALVRRLGEVITKRLLRLLESESTEREEKYDEFYREFSRFLKEGICNDFSHREALAGLLRFESSMTEPGKLVRLADYKARMKEGQKQIYYQLGPSREAIEQGPYLEGFRSRGLEVLYALDPVDEYVFGALGRYEDLEFAAVDRADLELEEVTPEGNDRLPEDEVRKLCGWLKETLGDRVADVTSSRRLVDSPVVALTPEEAPSAPMRAMLRAMGQPVEPLKVRLEINPAHELVRGLAAGRETNPETARLVAAQLLDNALLSAGLLENGHGMVQRLNELMARAISPRS